VDVTPGDWLTLYYIDLQDNYFSSSFYTTQPSVTVTDYPSAVQPHSPVTVHFTLSGAHSSSVYVYWGNQPGQYLTTTPYQVGAIGPNVISFNAPSGGTLYFQVSASIDGQWVNSPEYSVDVADTSATTLVDPVSGTTNDATPTFIGSAAPNVPVSLYEGTTLLGSTTSDSQGWFAITVATPLGNGAHSIHAVATVGGTPGPSSNLIQLTVNTALLVDPVHILVTTRGVTQHLRDDAGFANLGGRIWTRTGDVVNISIPVSCAVVDTADLYVGGVLATAMLNDGAGTFLAAYTPPATGTYAVDLRLRCDGPGGTLHTINIMSGLIDPDGFVYEANLGIDHRLAGATVTLYQLNGSEWQMWPASIWSQTNPQTTGSDGYYSFFTLPGQYRVVVTLPGHFTYTSPTLTVVDEPVHHNVPLRLIYALSLPAIQR
jgi:hypothetical protein